MDLKNLDGVSHTWSEGTWIFKIRGEVSEFANELTHREDYAYDEPNDV